LDRTLQKSAWIAHGAFRVLAAEEELGREVISSLDAEQKKVAIVDAKAYPGRMTTNSRKAALRARHRV